jgi:homocysteine S-methyltransferase
MVDSRFLTALTERVILGDGAYGTEFLRRGSLPGRPLDELNLTRPQTVLELHREYIDAGSELTKTNTFLANGFRLKPHGLGDQVREINIAGVQLAKEAARGGLVAGVVGPLKECPRNETPDYYREQCRALAEAGCDVLLLETFLEATDLLIALQAARETGLPAVAQMAQKAERNLDRLVEGAAYFGAAVVGTNCISAEEAEAYIQRLHKNAKVPLSAFPSAGLPEERLAPKPFARALKGIVDAGARLVGGCCGTGPAHIREAAALLGKGR